MYWEVWVFFHEPFKKSFSRFAEIPVEKFLDLFDVLSPLFLLRLPLVCLVSVVDCDFLICKAYRVNKLDENLVGTTLPSDFSFAASAQGLCDLVLLYYLTLLDLSSINLTNV